MEHFVWDIDPVLIRLGPIQIRYYGILFAMVLVVGFHFVKKDFRRMNVPEDVIYSYFYWVAILGILGARVGHCLFYEPARYLSNPLEILYIWKGGLASHGGTIGILLGVLIYSKRHKIPLRVVGDVSAYAAVCAAFFVRVGNFFNSEIVGRVTDVPWAMHFPRSYVGGEFARHPSQLYEAAIGLTLFIIVLIVDHKLGNRKPRGIMMIIFLLLYFPARFFVEFVKEYQTLPGESVLTMGQYLSIPFFLFGLVLIYWVKKDWGRLTGEIPPDTYELWQSERKKKKS